MIVVNKCGNCGITEGEFEVHHIVPRSRGGTDEPSNLQTLCVDCHGKVHDVTFKGKSGVVSESLQKKKVSLKLLNEWICDNEKEIHLFVVDFFKVYETTVLTELLYFDAVSTEILYHWIFTGKNFRRTNYGMLPAMVREHFLSGEYSIPEIVFSDDSK